MISDNIKKYNSEEPKKDNISDHTMDALKYFIVNFFVRDNVTLIYSIPPKVVGVEK